MDEEEELDDFGKQLLEAMMTPVDLDAPIRSCQWHMLNGSVGSSGKLVIPEEIDPGFDPL